MNCGLDHTIRRQMLEIETGNAHLGIICGLPQVLNVELHLVWIQSY